ADAFSRKCSSRGQHREHLAAAAQRDVIGAAFALIERIDLRTRRTAPAGLDHALDRVRRTGKDRLDRAVATIAHPAIEPARERHALGEGAKAHALHATADDDTADHR